VNSFYFYLKYKLDAKKIKEIYLYGTGIYAKELLTFFDANDISVLALLDDGFGQNHFDDFDIPILKTDTIEKTKPIVIASRNYQDIIFERLSAMGIENVRIFKVFEKVPNVSFDEKITLNFTKNKNCNKINNIFFVGDNTDTPNFGCRATSIALASILSNSVTLTDRIHRKEILELFSAIPCCENWELYIYSIKKFNKPIYDDLICRIKKVDAVILNGEGSFIFQSPPRIDLHNYLVILYACIEAGKPFFILNFMFTAFAGEPINKELMLQTLKFLENANAICVRDNESKQLIEQNNNKILVNYVPDALFTWFEIFNKNDKILKDMITYSHFSLPFCENNYFNHNLDFLCQYMLLSGNSYARYYKYQAEKSFIKLAIALKNKADELGLKLYLIECCSEDAVLHTVSKITGIPIIPVTINIYLAGYILANAQCFVTGRYHPAILASLGGTPCVFMGSNSHKTTSLQEVLEIPNNEQMTFSAIPNENEILGIIECAERQIANNNREKRKIICKNNAILANNIITLLKEE